MTEENRDKIVRNSPFSCLPPAVQRERVRSVRLKSGAAQGIPSGPCAGRFSGRKENAERQAGKGFLASYNDIVACSFS